MDEDIFWVVVVAIVVVVLMSIGLSKKERQAERQKEGAAKDRKSRKKIPSAVIIRGVLLMFALAFVALVVFAPCEPDCEPDWVVEMKAAAAQGDPTAQLWLADCYWNGHGVAQNYFVAKYWLERAAAQGDSTAQYWIGRYYKDGNAAWPDRPKAAYWLRKAAAQGNWKANEELNDLGR